MSTQQALFIANLNYEFKSKCTTKLKLFFFLNDKNLRFVENHNFNSIEEKKEKKEVNFHLLQLTRFKR